MSHYRGEVAGQLPPAPERLRALMPTARLRGTLFREHAYLETSEDGGCWFFSSTGAGRFDIAPPWGTCYFAETEGVAARERCGRLMAMGVPITEAIYHGRVVSRIEAPTWVGDMADFSSAASLVAGVTAELHACTDYETTQAWAAACRDAGFGGLTYPPRFTPGGREVAYAVFGTAGAHPELGTLGRRRLIEVLHDLGYATLSSDELTQRSLDVDDSADPPGA